MNKPQVIVERFDDLISAYLKITADLCINATLKLATQKRLVYDDKWFNPEIRSITHAVRNKLSQRLARYSGPLRFKVILPSRLDTDNWVFDFITKVYISKPPKTNAQGQMHCTTGPALTGPGGMNIYALNGVIMPDWLGKYMTKHALQPAMLLKIANVEQRKEFVRHPDMGYDRIMHGLGGKTIDSQEMTINNGKEQFKHHYEVVEIAFTPNNANHALSEHEQGRVVGEIKWRFLKMLNPSISTPDNPIWHLEGVPLTTKTVKEALQFRKPAAMKAIKISATGEDWYQQGDVCVWPREAKSLKPLPILLT